ncbi:Protein GLUTAMINE DUMPER 3 [Platanthera guangdongensis]|uniref:Protein GLUTAMINE DUMPER 3 n=1 Tax=Platanthera guangdongensis TaxID=2320717 RepID=A0ABR2MWR2_9ASPA
MRPGATFAQEQQAHPPAASAVHSPWHSPVPYLFGGLAAMLGLIAFALLILACSYWKLSGYLEGGGGEGGDLSPAEEEQKAGDGGGKPAASVYEERIVVIMAGDKKPTFLATPMSSRASSFGEKNTRHHNRVVNGAVTEG